MTRLVLAAAVAAAFTVAPAYADTTCQDLAAGLTACVTTDTEGPGAAVEAGPLCVVVNASC